MLLVGACGPPTPAPAPTPGPTATAPEPIPEAVVYPVFDAAVVISASVDEADGDVWFAVEHAPTLFARPDVDLIRFRGDAVDTFRLSTDRLVTQVGHLPVVLAEEGRPVHVLTKESESQAQATLELYTVDDGVFGPEPIRPPTPYRAGRMQMVADPTSDALHLCWRGIADGEEDVYGLAGADAAAMRAVVDATVAAEPGVVEDHCDVAVDATGTRYTAFHRLDTSDTVFLQITAPGDPSPQASGALVLPPGATGADFPTLAAEGDRVLIATAGTQGELDAVSIWDCARNCSELSDFVPVSVDPPGDVHVQIRALLADGHALLFYKSNDGGREQIALSTLCAGETEWTHHPPLVDTPDTAFSTIPGGSTRTVAFDAETQTLHAALIDRRGPVQFGLLGWSAPLALYCP
jgi:hypothetical protein